MNGREILIFLAVKFDGEWDKIVASIRNRDFFDPKEAEATLASVKSQVVTIVDPDYPASLKEAPKPPFVLFYYGNLGLIDDKKMCISYVGSRKASPYGLKMAHQFCSSFAEDGFSVVSGLAYGIDAAAARAAMPAKKAVAVLGNGPDYYYPPENAALQRQIKENGLLISEYPGESAPNPERFPARNRLIAALSQCTVVGEASKHSGTLITVAHALGIGRDVCCVPYPADEESACNALIKEGAPMVENAADVYEVMSCIGTPPLDPEKK
jgi:DNA processing protein